MTRASGFQDRPISVASSRLTSAVAASLAIAAFSLCLIVALTVLSTKASMAMALPSCVLPQTLSVDNLPCHPHVISRDYGFDRV